jgi:hypothetical protein
MTCTGEQGSVSSSGHEPDQGMMIYIALADLLFGVRGLLAGQQKRFDFVGADSSFSLTFRRGRKGLSVATETGVVARTTETEIARELLSAAEALERRELNAVPDDAAAKQDLGAALAKFREVVG